MLAEWKNASSAISACLNGYRVGAYFC